MPEGTRWASDDLIHPDKKAITADNAYGYNRPYAKCEHEEPE
jgi:hypothetical protein